MHAAQQPVPPVPVVDFTTHAMVLAAIGTRNSGGYTVALDSLVTFEAGTAVFTTETRPGGSCFVTAALTQPVVAVRAPTPMDSVAFFQVERSRNCG
jgi:hypothetical protein